MKELEGYLRETYSDIFQPDITTETPATFPDPDIPTLPDSGIKHPRIDIEITYLEKKKIN